MTESLPFSKWEGLGNDFVVLDVRGRTLAQPEGLARRLCDRHFGIGADGLALLQEAAQGSPFAMEIYNADGSRAQMCGNALRCLATLAVRSGLAPQESWFSVATASGPRRVRVGPDLVEVDMGSPRALRGEGPVDLEQIELQGQPQRAVLTSMGNPHCVLPLDRELTDWQDWGRRLEHGPLAPPDGINVEFVEVLAPDRLRVRVWERGAGPTLACGTGACATLVAVHSLGLCQRQAWVELPGGKLDIEWSESGTVLMRGPARQLFSGEWRPDP